MTIPCTLPQVVSCLIEQVYHFGKAEAVMVYKLQAALDMGQALLVARPAGYLDWSSVDRSRKGGRHRSHRPLGPLLPGGCVQALLEHDLH
jgi:hypothetical protein